MKKTILIGMATLLVLTLGSAEGAKKKKKAQQTEREDPYAEYVWPPPPDDPHIKLEDVITGRLDVEADSKFKKMLIGASPQGTYDRLKKPFAVAFDPQGRVLVSDSGNAAIVRFDREGSRMDVLGTQGNIRLRLPLGLDVGADGTIYVADAGLKQVVALDPEGGLKSVYGRGGELVNPTDAALSPDETQLYVADSKAHRILIFDVGSGKLVTSFGEPGDKEGQLGFPTSLAFDAEGNLFVVDQINARVVLYTADGEPLDQLGSFGRGFGQFVRPKDIAVDEAGLIYVTDNALNNLQLFDLDFTLLTFVGEGGNSPGRFSGASGVAVRGEEFAIVDQLGARLQLFRFLIPKTGE